MAKRSEAVSTRFIETLLTSPARASPRNPRSDRQRQRPQRPQRRPHRKGSPTSNRTTRLSIEANGRRDTPKQRQATRIHEDG